MSNPVQANKAVGKVNGNGNVPHVVAVEEEPEASEVEATEAEGEETTGRKKRTRVFLVTIHADFGTVGEMKKHLAKLNGLPEGAEVVRGTLASRKQEIAFR